MTFTATQFDTAKDKEWFFEQFKKFVMNGFEQKYFTKKFYARLSMTFGHIAHYDQGGFWEEFFTTTADKIRFLEQTLEYPCYGNPAFTYSDVEKELIAWLKTTTILAHLHRQWSVETESNKR